MTGGGSASIGATSQVAVVITNAGARATNVSLTVNSNGPAITSLSGAGWSCSPQGELFWNCFRSALPDSGSQLAMSVALSNAGTSGLSATVASTEVDLNRSNNFATVTFEVIEAALRAAVAGG